MRRDNITLWLVRVEGDGQLDNLIFQIGKPVAQDLVAVCWRLRPQMLGTAPCANWDFALNESFVKTGMVRSHGTGNSDRRPQQLRHRQRRRFLHVVVGEVMNRPGGRRNRYPWVDETVPSPQWPAVLTQGDISHLHHPVGGWI